MTPRWMDGSTPPIKHSKGDHIIPCKYLVLEGKSSGPNDCISSREYKLNGSQVAHIDIHLILAVLKPVSGDITRSESEDPSIPSHRRASYYIPLSTHSRIIRQDEIYARHRD